MRNRTRLLGSLALASTLVLAIAACSGGGEGGGGDGMGGGDAGAGVDAQPERLADKLSFPGALVVAEGSVIWVNEGSTNVSSGLSWAGAITSIPKAGGAVTSLASLEASPHGLAIDGARLFWTNTYPGSSQPYELATMPLSGGTPALVPSGGLPYAVAEGWLYVVRDGAIWRRPTGGGAEEKVATADDVDSITARGDRVYWALQGGGVRAITLGAAGSAVVAEETACSEAIAVDDTHVYWAQLIGCNGDHTVIERAPLAGGAVEEVAGSGGVTRFLLDGSDIIFGTTTSVSRVPKAGGAPVVIAAGNYPAGLGVDTTHVYWTYGMNAAGEWDSGELWRAPK